MHQLRLWFSASRRDSPPEYQHINHTSMIQIILGTITFILGCTARVSLKDFETNLLGAGIWSGAIMVITGVYGFRSVRKLRDKHAAATRFRVFSTLTLMILLAAFYVIILCLIESYHWLGCESRLSESSDYWLTNKDFWLCRYVYDEAASAFGMNVALLVLTVMNFGVVAVGMWYAFVVLYIQHCGPFVIPSTLAKNIIYENLSL